MQEMLILVDENDREMGVSEKLQTHKEGKLHRGFSIFIFDQRGKLLLQQRSLTKYHCPGLWSNTCCGHPRHGENIEETAHRRLEEEMGFNCDLKEVGSFVYKTKFGNGLHEHEYLHVFKGVHDQDPDANPQEAEAWKWVSIPHLQKDILKNPSQYTYWFKLCFSKLGDRLK
ncbi:isopentenyl-diphosphate Delta-isomerase [Candidatus Woesearchaeota archaeon]|nr:isopentenyl-diphosphate Delta-isomerase [Candidatus Woesearchaeota archaeon]